MGQQQAASTGAFGASFSRQALAANSVSSYVGHHGGWLWPAIAVGCLLIGLACLRWLLALLASTDRAGDIIIGDSTDEGTTVLLPAALIDALTGEISTYHGVEAAKGRVIGEGRDPEIVLAITTTPPLTCPPCTAGSSPRPSPTPGWPPGTPRCRSSSTSHESATASRTADHDPRPAQSADAVRSRP